MTEPRLRVEHIDKSFAGVHALKDVSFEVLPGQVHALCGENGAGKSTLMKIINGLYRPDAGTISVNGAPAVIRSPQDAQALGIAMIAQELNYVPEMTVAENFFIGRTPMKPGRIDWARMRTEARQIIAAEGLACTPDQRLRTLTVSQIQMLEILRAVHHKADIIIMDEPTSAIAQREVEVLFAKIRALTAQGVAVIYISHKMDEVFQIADQVTVLRDGVVVSTDPATRLTLDDVVTRMVGRKLDQQFPKEAVPIGDVAFRASSLGLAGTFADVTMEIRAGEIVGLAGLVGAGRSELVNSVFGLEPLDQGEITVGGRPVKIKSPVQAINHGVVMLSEDRRLMGIVPKLSVKKNATLASLRKVIFGGRAHGRLEQRVVTEYCERMRVKTPSIETLIESLSGGNQQKVLLAKWLLVDPQVLLLDEPTRGIDVGAKYEIYKLMTDLARQGKAVLMISSEMPELIGMCDRIYVMAQGRLTAELSRPDFSQERILRYAMAGLD
ncbi:MAG: sugar ABC transporter ATP-binding protein [Propionibacteriaceae bacterium]|jgi:inositol transport system ATP-binding protein|nr:sugar ABC transporter ATP-binding protein [Propionibacteriaceae bacterium]